MSDTSSEEDDEILQLKGNRISKGLVSLEKLFDQHDCFIKKQQEN